MRLPITLALPLLLFAHLSAQPLRRPVTIGGGMEIGVPFGEFGDSWGKEMLGLSGNFTVPMGILPFDYGFDFAWARMGGEKDDVHVNEEYIESTEGRLAVNSNIYGYHGLLRLKPFTGKVSPYIEGMAGVRQFTTHTSLTVDGVDDPLMEQRNTNDFVFSHGLAAGIQVAPSKVFYIEGRVERLEGGKVTYVDPGSIEIDPAGNVTYGTLTSGTHVVNVHLGIGFKF
ncbi:MAG: hypothetical protein R2815_12175 [Flavobacteriales bacterium]|nr:hypothetical protein [Flavobacteriales bacterium]